jgi:diguanylate cyclase (GGDEF)-like protein/PAS domain S-box-containing protein
MQGWGDRIDIIRDEPIEGWPNHVLANAPVLVAYIDASECYRFANAAYLEWLGIEPEAMIGRHVCDIVGAENYESIRNDLHTALGGKLITYEREMFSGSARRYAHGIYKPDFDKSGVVRGIVVVVSDITERRALELRLLESETRFSGAFHHAAIGMALVDPAGRWLRVNAALCLMLGYAEEELLVQSFQAITHPEDLATDMGLVGQLLDGVRESYHMEKRYFHKDGHTVHVLLSVSLVRDAQRKPRYFVSQIQDITERKTFEEALFRERELAEVTLKSIGDAVITTNLQLRITSLNPIAEAMTGWSNAEARGRPMDEVFRLLDVQTRKPITNPLHAAVTKNIIIGLATDAVLVHRNGFDSPVEDSAAPIHDHAGNVIGGVLVFHDVSETRALALKMAHLAHHDTLTGLPNRALLHSRIEQAIGTAQRRQHRAAVLFIDIDHFKQINDTLGHSAGDNLLQAVAKRIRTHIRSDDTVSRFGGDEFVVLLPRIDEAADAVRVAETLLEQCCKALSIEAADLAVNFSIGISTYPDHATDAESLIRHADTAMYEAKLQGRNGFRVFDPSMNEQSAARVLIEVELRKALAHEELRLHYQPIVDTRTGAIIGAEALLRWQVDGVEVYSPEQFIPVAEDCGLIVSIGEWVLREACRQAAHWTGLYRPVAVSVNVSVLQLQHANFFGILQSALADSGLSPTLLELELTERMVMTGGDQISTLLAKIKALGITLTLDDFGTGYSSLSYLKHFPIDALKIDRAFVRDVAIDGDSAAITAAIIAMAHGLNKTVVAEGVETAAQGAYLRAAGCPQMQGFLFGRAVPADDFEALLANNPDYTSLVNAASYI